MALKPIRYSAGKGRNNKNLYDAFVRCIEIGSHAHLTDPTGALLCSLPKKCRGAKAGPWNTGVETRGAMLGKSAGPTLLDEVVDMPILTTSRSTTETEAG